MIMIVSDMKAISAFVLETRPLSFHPQWGGGGAYNATICTSQFTYQRPASQRDAAGINIAKYAWPKVSMYVYCKSHVRYMYMCACSLKQVPASPNWATRPYIMAE